MGLNSLCIILLKEYGNYAIHNLSIGKWKRIRCGVCQSCLSSDCGKCKYCLDKPKFGGTSRLRQSCLNKKCQNMPANSIITLLHRNLYL